MLGRLTFINDWFHEVTLHCHFHLTALRSPHNIWWDGVEIRWNLSCHEISIWVSFRYFRVVRVKNVVHVNAIRKISHLNTRFILDL